MRPPSNRVLIHCSTTKSSLAAAYAEVIWAVDEHHARSEGACSLIHLPSICWQILRERTQRRRFRRLDPGAQAPERLRAPHQEQRRSLLLCLLRFCNLTKVDRRCCSGAFPMRHRCWYRDDASSISATPKVTGEIHPTLALASRRHATAADSRLSLYQVYKTTPFAFGADRASPLAAGAARSVEFSAAGCTVDAGMAPAREPAFVLAAGSTAPAVCL